MPAVAGPLTSNMHTGSALRSARFPVNLIGSPISYANRLIGSPITSHLQSGSAPVRWPQCAMHQALNYFGFRAHSRATHLFAQGIARGCGFENELTLA